jgi:transcriptional regulator with XRE-family HTH domain
MADEQHRRSGAYERFGTYVRNQRQMAQLTLRQVADLASISNPYLSQIERGLHQPSVTVIRSIADALNLSADVLLAQVAGLDPDAVPPPLDTEAAIKADPRLTAGQKSALLSVYRTMVAQADPAPAPPAAADARDAGGSQSASGDEPDLRPTEAASQQGGPPRRGRRQTAPRGTNARPNRSPG